ncbi:hypothetical protein ECG_09486 [Echinococcus granulosus]|uniref:EF HAND 1 calcium binding site n=1 Tax=Echinococcus granulosus TaxID=6210 RepID=U6J9B7_ECHGR|nr:hypothetical protein EGR_07615 [Echinococcus granulosus]EUB57524.1 hypothetical protein EGR_07615 [Echinococcus granulosus]KAH9277937.1 hypothetical protein ECG_09486 [Echinococcus granulosus]CDS20706.1 EF HAND 1 calcium binding site [Echinococcus granulosus]
MECNDLNAGQNAEADDRQNPAFAATEGEDQADNADIAGFEGDGDDDDEELTELLQQQQQEEVIEQPCPPEEDPEVDLESFRLRNRQPEVTSLDGDALLGLPMIRVDFDTLTPDAESGVDIPLCIAGPLFGMLEAVRCEMRSRSTTPFFGRMEELVDEQKYVYLDNKIMGWLVQTCRLYSESNFLFKETDSLYAFHVFTRILNLIEPKLFPISHLLARQAEQTNLYCTNTPFLETRRVASDVVEDCDDGRTMAMEDLLHPERTEVFLSVINNLYAMIYFDLYHIVRQENRDIVRFIFLILLQAFREYIEGMGFEPPIPRGPLYSLHTILKFPEIFKPMLGSIGERVGRALFEVPFSWIHDVHIRHIALDLIDPEARQYQLQLVKRIVESIFTINSPMVFARGSELGSVIFHNAEEDERCVCRLLDKRIVQPDYCPHIV